MSELEGRIRESFASDSPGTILLETVAATKRGGRTLLFTDPVEILSCYRPEDVESTICRLDSFITDGYACAGYITYEGGVALHLPSAVDSSSSRPLVWFGVYESPVEVPALLVEKVLDEIISGSHGLQQDPTGEFAIGYNDYIAAVAQVKHHIREGDVYQINFTAPINFESEVSSLALYSHLRRRQRVEFAAYIRTGFGHVLSLSPELFFERRGPTIMARPMKGTAPRGDSILEDEQQRKGLAGDEKNRAENLMIVDLIRNDLSRVCQPGSVEVPALFDTELYETVIQMTSTVHGTLRADADYCDIFRAIFPSGSITGAPKRRAMEIIASLEAQPRGVYCGSIGYILPAQEAAFNVAIRTIESDGPSCKMGIGSGIVWDSRADAEFDECLLKASFLGSGIMANSEPGAAVELIETMRYDGTIKLLDRHMQRLATSASFFGYPVDINQLQLELENRLNDVHHKSRVRLTLNAAGESTITVDPLPEYPEIHRLMVSDHALDPDDVMLYHKTTRRDTYNTAYEDAVRRGFDEVVFLNSRGEVAEGSISNIFVERDGALLTPPVPSGLLPGVYRDYLLATDKRAREAVLSLVDLRNATQLYICNAVRGLCPAALIEVE